MALYSAVKQGALTQITAMSITGEFGYDARRFSIFLLRHNLAHVIATDAHSSTHRPPLLNEAVQVGADIIGEERANDLVTEIPGAIIEGKPALLPDPIDPSQNQTGLGQKKKGWIKILSSPNISSMALISSVSYFMIGALFSLSRGGITGFSISFIFLGGIIRTRRSLQGFTKLIDISEESMKDYSKAIGTLKSAIALQPSSVYYGTLADIYTRLGKWARILEAPLPPSAINKSDALEKAIKNYGRAIDLFSTNSNCHLSLGQINEIIGGNPNLTVKEFSNVLFLVPGNKPVRYSIAYHFAMTGRHGDALEQARILARMDATDDLVSSLSSDKALSRRDLTRLRQGYLHKSLEIAWWISQDPEVVKGIAPDTPGRKGL